MFRLNASSLQIGVMKDIFYVEVKINFYFVLSRSFSRFLGEVTIFVKIGSVKATLC